MAQPPPQTPVNPYTESTKHLVPKRTGPDREGAKSKLAGPAGGLILTSLFTIVLAAGSSLTVLTMMGITVVFSQEEEKSTIRVNRPDEDEGPTEEEKEAQMKMEQGAQFLNVAIVLVVSLVVIFLNTVILIGAMKMKKLESYAFASVASRLAIVPIISPLIVLGIPFGIWGVAMLSDKKVRAAFNK